MLADFQSARTHLIRRCSKPLTGSDCRFEFHKRSQLFIGPHNETLSVAAMGVSNSSLAAQIELLSPIS
jgi:hypothetical protein